MKKKILISASATVMALSLAACSGNSSTLDDVQYSMNDATAAPSASFETPFKANETAVHIIEEGSGDEIKDGDKLLVNATVFSGEDASNQNSTYTGKPILLTINDQLKESSPELYDTLTSAKVGTSFSYTSNMVQSQDAKGNPSPSPAGKDTASNVEVYTVESKLLTEATGKETPKSDINSALSSFTIGDDGAGEIKLAENRGDAPKELVSQNLITGEGEKVSETDNLYVKYQGVRWEDGKAFDGNFQAEPAELNLQQVIEGWTEGLKDKTVGSRVLLIIPEEMAYGKDAGDNAPSGPLVFVVDILDASKGVPVAETSVAPSDGTSPSATGASSASETPASSETPSASASAQ